MEVMEDVLIGFMEDVLMEVMEGMHISFPESGQQHTILIQFA